jgi:hypothetical protein
MTAQEIAYAILMDSAKDPVTVFQELKPKYAGTPLEEFFGYFEKNAKGLK